MEGRTHLVVGEWLTNEQQPVAGATAASAEHFAAVVNPPVARRSTQDARGYTAVGEDVWDVEVCRRQLRLMEAPCFPQTICSTPFQPLPFSYM